MALTEEQEAKLLQLLSAYENGKRVGDLPEVTPGKDSAGLMVEVVDTDGESKKFDLGNVAPVLNITSFGSVQTSGSRRLRRVDRKGDPIWTDRNDPNGYCLSPEEYGGECVPVLDEYGNQAVSANGHPLYADTTSGVELIQETRAIQAFVPKADFDVSRLKIGLRVSIKDSEGVTDSNWSVSEIDEKGFTVRNANGETSQFFCEGEFWVGKGTDGIAEGSRIMTLAIGYGHTYKLGDAERIEGYDYPYGNDILDGGRYSFVIDSLALGHNSPGTFTGNVALLSGKATGWFTGTDDIEGLRVVFQIGKGEDGFWNISYPEQFATDLERTRPDTFYSHMIPLRSFGVISLLTEAYSADCGQVVRGLLNPDLEESLYAILTSMPHGVPFQIFYISVMDSDGTVYTEDFRLKPIQGGAIDALEVGCPDHIAIEFYLIVPGGQMYFVRLVYDSGYNIIEDESIIPDGVYI